MSTTSTFLTGLFFELPVIMYLLAKIGILSSAVLKKYRRHSIVVILILSAIITPPDVISQLSNKGQGIIPSLSEDNKISMIKIDKENRKSNQNCNCDLLINSDLI